MNKTILVVAVASLLAGCVQRVYIPDTDAGKACYRECVSSFNACRIGQGEYGCQLQRRDCFLSCPGAQLAEN